MMKITKETLRRAIRTFIQAFCGALLSAGAGIEWYNVDIEKALLGVVITSIFAYNIGENLVLRKVK